MTVAQYVVINTGRLKLRIDEDYKLFVRNKTSQHIFILNTIL